MSSTLEAGFKSNARHVIGYCREKLYCYGANVAAGFWMCGDVLSTSMVGLGGTFSESIGGATMLTASPIALFCGHTRFGFPAAAALALAGFAVQQSGPLSSGHPLAWLGVAANAAVTIPVCAEPWTASWAKNKIGVVQRVSSNLDHARQACLHVLANPRPLYGLATALTLVPVVINDLIHDRYRMLPVYGLLALGSLTSALSRPPDSLPALPPAPAPS